jgi:hypothetical protein
LGSMPLMDDKGKQRVRVHFSTFLIRVRNRAMSSPSAAALKAG